MAVLVALNAHRLRVALRLIYSYGLRVSEAIAIEHGRQNARLLPKFLLRTPSPLRPFSPQA